MSEPTTKQSETSESKTQKKPGFFGRMAKKLDDTLKQKAEETSQQSRCCGGSDKTGGKCC